MSANATLWHQRRRHELDWLRVLAFALLILYHIGMAYVGDWGWHIKSRYQSDGLQNLMLWSNQWRMSLLFMISGAAISYQLQRDASWRFFNRSAQRLLLPLLFGSLVIVAPQAFVELKLKGYIPATGYLSFWRDYLGLGEPLPAAYGRLEPTHITWNHLWYLAYLFVFISILWILYPLIIRARRLALWLNQHAGATAVYLLPIILLFLIGELLWEKFPTTHLLLDDWYTHARYFSVFFIGFALVRSNKLWAVLQTHRQLSLLLALASYASIVFYAHGGHLSHYLTWMAPLEAPLRGWVWSANSWLWIMAITGYAQVWWQRPHPLIQKANQGVYCYYILHQTFIVLTLYGLGRYALGPIIEPLLLTAITLVGCTIGYLLARRLPYGRSLLGIKS